MQVACPSPTLKSLGHSKIPFFLQNLHKGYRPCTMLSSGFPSLLESFNVLVTVLLLTFLTKLYGARRRMVELRRKGLVFYFSDFTTICCC